MPTSARPAYADLHREERAPVPSELSADSSPDPPHESLPVIRCKHAEEERAEHDVEPENDQQRGNESGMNRLLLCAAALLNHFQRMYESTTVPPAMRTRPTINPPSSVNSLSAQR